MYELCFDNNFFKTAFYLRFTGTCKVRNEIETKRFMPKRNEIYRNETKPIETKRNLPKRNQTEMKPKRNEMKPKRNKIK